MKVIIVGGVAGGASAAARLRRLDEKAEIILIERGEYVSYANCGLPYYVGGEITDREDLSVQTPESLRERLHLDVRTCQEVAAVRPDEKTVEIKNLLSGESYTENYDKLILSPGAEPFRPAFPGIEDSRIFTLRTIPDTYAIDDFIKEHSPMRALVVGAGFIGLEMAENLKRRGLSVTVAELSDHVIATLDIDMAADVHHYLKKQNIELLLQNGVQSFEPRENHLHVKLNRGSIDVDMVLLSIGVRPESTLAKEAGLLVNDRGAIVVDDYMCTSNSDIYAVGDAVQIKNPITGDPGYVPLAGPANKQGRIAADNIAGKIRSYPGTLGTAILKLFDMVIGTTGLSESAAQKAGINYDKVFLSPASHATYYPGAKPLNIKVLFERGSGLILGAQIVGFDGVDKRLDVLSTAIQAKMTADELAKLELGYAPPFSSAKDPVNMAGFMIQNILEGSIKQFHWNEVADLFDQGVSFLDARTPEEYRKGHIEGAINIPLDELRERLRELDAKNRVYLYCQTGHRSYMATRILLENGFDAYHLAGGYRLYRAIFPND